MNETGHECLRQAEVILLKTLKTKSANSHEIKGSSYFIQIASREFGYWD
jgi:hypothetical protein